MTDNADKASFLAQRVFRARLERARLWSSFQKQRGRLGLPVIALDLPVGPVYSFVRGQRGVLRMVSRPAITGASGLRDEASTEFNCTPQQVDGTACLVLSGELDLVSVATFRAHLTMAGHAARGIVLDLRNLRYLDSTGINALLEAHRTLSPSGRRMAMVASSPLVHKVLSVLAIESIIPSFETLDAALAYVRSDGDSEVPHTG
ncbi:MAG TPA: STAS domain-containing protein [bacterium]|nr:STAS domain-containing protein [bacterium]